MKNLTMAEKIKYARASKGWTQTFLANKAGTTLQTVWKIENGRCKPNPLTLKAIASALRVPLRDLTGGEK